VVDAERKVASRPVRLAHVDERIAVVEGIAPGTKVVVEGAQNLRPGVSVTEGETAPRAEGGKKK
jgi:hypothetical protein